MNPQIPDEVISAYFDGEVTPEERAAVEGLLAGSDEAQRELNETARLSALLHSFPRESAPVELVGNVLQQTTQMALPSQPAAAAPLARREMRAWKAALISTLISTFSTAAACVLIVRNFNDHKVGTVVAENRLKAFAPMPASIPQESPMLSDLARAEKSDAKLARAELQFAAPEAAAGHFKSETKRAAPAPSGGRGGGGGAASIAAAAGPADASRDKSPQPRSDDAQSTTMTAKAGLGMQPVQFDDLNYGNLLSNGVVLEGLREGKVYFPQVADPENNVAVVDVRVVDVDKGVDTFQVLLTKRSIPSRSMNEKKKTAQAKLKQSDGAETELVVIYLVAPGEVLAQTLKDVELHPDLFLGWSSQPPLHLANNDEAKSQVRKKMAEATTALNAVKKAESDKPNAFADESGADLAEANQAVQAFVDRNNAYAVAANAANSNSERQPEPKERAADVKRDLAEGSKKDADGTLEKAKEREQRRGGVPLATEQATSNYFLPIRVNNPAQEAANPSYNRSMSLNPTNFGIAGGQAGFGGPAAGKPQRDINTPVRMLLVLHQAQPEEASGTPSPPDAPAAKPGR